MCTSEWISRRRFSSKLISFLRHSSLHRILFFPSMSHGVWCVQPFFRCCFFLTSHEQNVSEICREVLASPQAALLGADRAVPNCTQVSERAWMTSDGPSHWCFNSSRIPHFHLTLCIQTELFPWPLGQRHMTSHVIKILSLLLHVWFSCWLG